MERLSREDANINFCECYRKFEQIIKKYERMKASEAEAARLAKECYVAQVELVKAKKQYEEAYH